jgi:hypothetical protein
MTFVIKPQAPFERLKIANTCPEVALRKAIILQAIIDASDISYSKSTLKTTIKARQWLFGNSKGFRESCYDANLDPDFVAKIASQIIEQHEQDQQRNNTKKIKKFSKDLSPQSQEQKVSTRQKAQN